MWKPQTIRFVLDGAINCLAMEQSLKSGKWKNSKPNKICITYPKKREGLAISFKDRVYQRSINDNALYPIMSRSFIYDNAACQKGKGTDFARARIKKFLYNFYYHHDLEGYILQIDIKGYYPNMSHEATLGMFRKRLAPDVYEMVKDVLNTQYSGDVGYNPGSQMVQIAGISLLDELDHVIKEELHAKYYIRYMDDFWILKESKEELERDLDYISNWLKTIGFEIHSDKTHIQPLYKPFYFLGFLYRLLPTGKIVMTLDPANVKHEKKKLRKLLKKATIDKVTECYISWKAHAMKGNSYKLLRGINLCQL